MSGVPLRGRVLVYSIIGCPHCLRAKNKLADLGIAYREISLDNYPAKVREELKQHSGGKTTVPQIFFNEVHVGGNDDLLKLVNDTIQWKLLMDKVQNEESPANAIQPPDPAEALDGGKEPGEFVCEPDDMMRLVHEMKQAAIIKDHRHGLSMHKNSFKGADLVQYIIDKQNKPKCEALSLAEKLIKGHFAHAVSGKDKETFDPDKLYRLLEDDVSKALNAGDLSDCSALPVSELGEDLRKLILLIFSRHLSGNGSKVDYVAMAKDADFAKYVSLTKQLHRVDLAAADRDERLAFFINIYNALVIHGTVHVGAPTNMWHRWKFFNSITYIIGGQTYNLQHIENGVLRANRKGVGMLWRPFAKNDPRLKVALPAAEPLIHFALNCGAKSCPPIKTFTAKGVNNELKVACESFLETDDGLKLDPQTNTAHLSQIFKWYREDFGGSPESILSWVSAHIGKGDKQEELTRMQEKGKVTVNYMPYDWGHNAKE